MNKGGSFTLSFNYFISFIFQLVISILFGYGISAKNITTVLSIKSTTIKNMIGNIKQYKKAAFNQGWYTLGPGIEPGSPAWQAGILTTILSETDVFVASDVYFTPSFASAPNVMLRWQFQPRNPGPRRINPSPWSVHPFIDHPSVPLFHPFLCCLPYFHFHILLSSPPIEKRWMLFFITIYIINYSFSFIYIFFYYSYF